MPTVATVWPPVLVSEAPEKQLRSHLAARPVQSRMMTAIEVLLNQKGMPASPRGSGIARLIAGETGRHDKVAGSGRDRRWEEKRWTEPDALSHFGAIDWCLQSFPQPHLSFECAVKMDHSTSAHL